MKVSCRSSMVSLCANVHMTQPCLFECRDDDDKDDYDEVSPQLSTQSRAVATYHFPIPLVRSPSTSTPLHLLRASRPKLGHISKHSHIVNGHQLACLDSFMSRSMSHDAWRALQIWETPLGTRAQFRMNERGQ